MSSRHVYVKTSNVPNPELALYPRPLLADQSDLTLYPPHRHLHPPPPPPPHAHEDPRRRVFRVDNGYRDEEMLTQSARQSQLELYPYGNSDGGDSPASAHPVGTTELILASETNDLTQHKRRTHELQRLYTAHHLLQQLYRADQELFLQAVAYNGRPVVATPRRRTYSDAALPYDYEREEALEVHYPVREDGAVISTIGKKPLSRVGSIRRERRCRPDEVTSLDEITDLDRPPNRYEIGRRSLRRACSADRTLPSVVPAAIETRNSVGGGGGGGGSSASVVGGCSRTTREDEPDIATADETLRQHLAECRCPCDHLGYTNFQEEDTSLFQPDLTRPGKQDVTFYPRHGSTPSSASAASAKTLTQRHWGAMLVVLLLAAAVGVGVPLALRVQSGASFEERLEQATRLLKDVPLIDGHNDLPWNIRKFVRNRLKELRFDEDLTRIEPWSESNWSHTDLPRLRAGQIGAQFWAAYVPCEAQFRDVVQLTLEQIDTIRRLTDKYQPTLTLCTSVADIQQAHQRGQICSLIGVEGGHSLASSLPVLRTLYSVGVRYLTLTSTCNTPWADCSLVDNPGRRPEHNGLTNFGKTIVKEMNRLGMLVDLSHVSVRTMKDTLEVSKAPVMFSHSSARALCNNSRNVPDHVLRLVAHNKGLVMINFYSTFLTCKDNSTVDDAVAHINHIRNVAGVDYVGLGAGYDGINYTPEGLEDVSKYPVLFAHLIGTGLWSVDDLKKLAGLNFLRVLQHAEKVRDSMRLAGVTPYEEDPPRVQSQNNCSSPSLF